jgi:hypothetical protein
MYTSSVAAQFPHLKINVVSPGFVKTNMTRGWGAKRTPEKGTFSIRHCLFKPLEGNGWFYGSNGVRFPLHFP